MPKCFVLPLEFDAVGRLSSFDEGGAVCQLLEAMAVTPQGEWGGGAHFGLLDFLEDANGSEENLRKIAKEANLAFEELGLKSCRVSRVLQLKTPSAAVQAFDFQITWIDGKSQTLSVPLAR